jgi:hypothetical protein
MNLQAIWVRPFRTILIAVILAVTPALAGCNAGALNPGTANAGGHSGGGTGTAPAQASQQLAELTVATGLTMAGYSRDKFPHWIGQGKGCDTRGLVLEQQGTDVQVNANCKIASGHWTSPYDGKSHSAPQGLQIDHVVPLANAWRSGAKNWTTQRRQEFANDLTRPQLLAVTGSVNESKGDQDPSQWKPPSRGFWCRYAQNWIIVKRYWQLTVTSAERSALTDMLGTCT